MNRPERTCIGCRGRSSKAELLRLVWSSTAVVVDVSQVEPGRGAYLHRNPDCLDLAVRRRAVGRALRTTQLDGARFAQAVQPFVSGDGRAT